jgi:hypothetical protein
MNVNRFQLALNHEDPEIVIKGLEEFTNLVLSEHDAIKSFGYCGRSIYSETNLIIHPPSITTIVGVLSSFIKSSPQCEELFVLWSISGRDEDRMLCSAHMNCLSAILFCASTNETICNNIVNRILSEFSKSLHMQLASGHARLIHSTIGLCISMSRSSPQNCRDVYQKLMFSSSQNLFGTLLQLGKNISWKAPKLPQDDDNNDDNDNSEDEEDNNEKISTDSRLLLVIWMLLIVEYADQNIASELLPYSSLFRRVTNSIHKDTPSTIKLILEGLLAVQKNSVFFIHCKLAIVDQNFQSKLLGFYKYEDQRIVELVHFYCRDFCNNIVKGYSNDRKGTGKGSARSIATNFIRQLEGHNDLRFRELQTILIKSQPYLLPRVVSSVAINWSDPQPSYAYLCAISHLTYLANTIDIDNQLKNSLKVCASGGKSDIIVKTTIDTLISTVVPISLTKKDICKILMHKNKLLQRSGLILLLAVTQRINRTVADTSEHRTITFESILNLTISKHFPDFQMLLNLRAQFMKIISGSTNNNEDAEVETNNNNNIKNKSKNIYLLVILLQIVESYVSIIPAVTSQNNFDLVKLLDEIFVWNSNESVDSMLEQIKYIDPVILSCTLRVLRSATNKYQCKWFGSNDDTVKVIEKVIVQTDWLVATKRSPLSKLLLLANCHINEFKHAAKSLVKLILQQSGIFHKDSNDVDAELGLELSSWQQSLSTSDESILLLDIILRVSYHWNTGFCMATDTMTTNTSTFPSYISAIRNEMNSNQIDNSTTSSSSSSSMLVSNQLEEMPISTALYCALSLCSCNFDVIVNYLPNHIKNRLSSAKEMNRDANSNDEVVSCFLSKYCSNFRSSLQSFVTNVILNVNVGIRNRGTYSNIILSTLKYLEPNVKSCDNISNKPVMDASISFIEEVTNLHLLMYFLANNDSSNTEVASVTNEVIDVKKSTKQKKNTSNNDINVSNNKIKNIEEIPTIMKKNSICSMSFIEEQEEIIENFTLNKVTNKNLRSSSYLIAGLSLELDKIINKSKIFNDIAVIQQLWMLIVDLRLIRASIPITIDLLDWIILNVNRLVVDDSGQITTVEVKASHISQAIKLLHSLSNLSIIKFADNENNNDITNTTTKKRKTRSMSVDDTSIDKVAKIKQICLQLTAYIIELMRSTACSTIIATSINLKLVQIGVMDDSLYGRYIRLILCAAASSYFRRISIQAKNKGSFSNSNSINSNNHELWNMIASEIRTKSLLNYKNDVSNEKNLSLFSLGWMVQRFVDDVNLRSMFIDNALDDRDGYALLDINSLSKNETDNDNEDENFRISAIDTIPLSILKSASISSLTIATKEFINHNIKSSNIHESTNVFNNGLIGVTVGVNSSNIDEESNQNEINLSEIFYYCDPLSIVDSTVISYIYNNNEDLKLDNIVNLIAPLSSSFISNTSNNIKEFIHFLTTLSLPSSLSQSYTSYADICSILNTSWICNDDNNSSNLKTIISTMLELNIVKENNHISNTLLLLSHDDLINETFVINLIAIFIQTIPEQQDEFLKNGSFVYYALCCTLTIVMNKTLNAFNSNQNFDVIDKLVPVLKYTSNYLFTNSNNLITQYNEIYSTDTKKHKGGLSEKEKIRLLIDLESQISCCSVMIYDIFTYKLDTSKNGIEANIDKFREILEVNDDYFRKKMNKWVKSCLKLGLDIPIVVDVLSNIVFNTYISSDKMLIWDEAIGCDDTDYHHPKILLQMVIGHSRFLPSLIGTDNIPNLQLLKLILRLIVLTTSDNILKSKISDKELQIDSADSFLLDSLLEIYQGSLSEPDRIVLRILHLLEKCNRIPPLCTLKPLALIKNVNGGSISSSLQSSWLVAAMTQSQVYSTLSSFPTWRSYLPQPLDIEGKQSKDIYQSEITELLSSLIKEWESNNDTGESNSSLISNEDYGDVDDIKNKSSIKTNMEVDSDSDGDSDVDGMNSDDDDHSDDSYNNRRRNINKLVRFPNGNDDEETPLVDNLLSDCSNKIYDPSYWLPAIHYALYQNDISIRQLANCGCIALVIASLGSSCPIIRTYSQSCLQQILILLKRQTKVKDAAFRERPQLLVLVNFLRNSFENISASLDKSDNGSKNDSKVSFCPRLPPTSTIILGRSAMHLLQAGHELFGKINKYLLSRPYCDIKDVPLYDYLVADGDSQLEQSERLVTLRLVRDGLSSKQDHLNLCRKNAYNRIMLLFPLLAKDNRAAHAVLDLLDKALGLRVSARYLLERCCIISWLKQMASPVNALHIEEGDSTINEISIDKTSDMIDLEDEELELGLNNKSTNKNKVHVAKYHSASTAGKVMTAAPVWMLSRILSLIRRAIGADYLLSSDGVPSLLHELFLTVSFIIDDVIKVDTAASSHAIPVEFYRQLVLCMWDCSLTMPANSSINTSTNIWSINRINRLALAISHSHKSGVSIQSDTDNNELLASLFSLLGFNHNARVNLSYHIIGNGKSTTEMIDLVSNTCKIVMNTTINLYIKNYQKNISVSSNENTTLFYTLLSSISNKTSNNVDNDKLFVSTVHLFSQDIVNTSSISSHDNEKEAIVDNFDLQEIFQNSWNSFIKTDLNSSPLPSIRNNKLTINMLTKGILNSILSCTRGIIAEEKFINNSKGLVNLASNSLTMNMLRWTLIIKKLCINNTNNSLSDRKISSLKSQFLSSKKKINARMLSVMDSSLSNDLYTTLFQDFQLLFRLTVISILCVLTNLSSFNDNNIDQLIDSLKMSIKTLLSSSTSIELNHGEFDIEIVMKWFSTSCCDSDSLDGLIWNISNRNDYVTFDIQSLCLSICNLSLGLVSSIVSLLDRNSPDDTGANDVFIYSIGPNDLISLCEKLNSLCSCDNDNISYMTSNNEDLDKNELIKSYFTNNDNKQKTLYTSLLFDLKSSQWRNAYKLGSEAITASMKIGAKNSLTGRTLTEEELVNSSKIDGDNDDNNSDEGDNDDDE